MLLTVVTQMGAAVFFAFIISKELPDRLHGRFLSMTQCLRFIEGVGWAMPTLL
jgi:hypothetical protein